MGKGLIILFVAGTQNGWDVSSFGTTILPVLNKCHSSPPFNNFLLVSLLITSLCSVLFSVDILNECFSVIRDKTGAEEDWSWVQGGRWTFQCVSHFQQSCSEIAVFSHLAQVGFNSKVTQRSLPLPSLIVTNESILTAAGKTQVKSLACLVVWLLMHFDYGFTGSWAEVLQQFNNFYLQKISQERLRAVLSCVHIPKAHNLL